MTNQKINDTQVLVGQPIDYPTKLISSINKILDHDNKIEKAYLACIQYADPKSSPKILIGINVASDIETIISNLVIQMKNNHIDRQLEFTDASKGQFMKYFSKIKPFYEREKK